MPNLQGKIGQIGGGHFKLVDGPDVDITIAEATTSLTDNALILVDEPISVTFDDWDSNVSGTVRGTTSSDTNFYTGLFVTLVSTPSGDWNGIHMITRIDDNEFYFTGDFRSGDTAGYVNGTAQTTNKITASNMKTYMSGATNLANGTINGDGYEITSSTGNNVSLSAADTDNWGLMTDELYDNVIANNDKLTCDTPNVKAALFSTNLGGTVTLGDSDDNIVIGGDLAIKGEIYVRGTSRFDTQTITSAAAGSWNVEFDSEMCCELNFTGSSAYAAALTLKAPAGMCYRTIKIKQASNSYAQTVTWAGELSAEVYWPGGSAPELSDGISEIDIITFFFDGTDFYGTASLDFS